MTAPAVTLGPVSGAALKVIAAAEDGITVTALARAAGMTRGSADAAIRVLDRHGCVRVLRHEKRTGKRAAVYGASTTGLAALEAAKETAQ